MKLCMIGTGYVGLVSGVCFADLGNDVICVDKDNNKINNLKKGIIPIYEPGLEELVLKNYKNKRLNFSINLKESIKKSDIVFVCVGTPTRRNSNSADLSQVYSVAKEISKSINKFKIIINKSTVPVTTGDEVEKIIAKKVSRKYFSVVSNPEFLREGEAIRDFIYPDRVVIGSNDEKSKKILKNLYSPLISKGAKFVSTNRRAAELIKYASNAFLATKITFINEIANLCEKTGVDVEDISIGIGLDKRIGSRFLRAGPALKNLLPILLSSPIPIEISSISIPVFSHKLDISFIKVIFVAKKALEAYLINSAALLFVETNFAPFDINGEYKLFKIFCDLLSFDPTTTLSGYIKSLIASPSLKNSGFDTTEKNFLLTFLDIIFSISSPVVTGTVDLLIIILNFLTDLDISFAAEYT